jgi:hypothetical protein
VDWDDGAQRKALVTAVTNLRFLRNGGKVLSGCTTAILS